MGYEPILSHISFTPATGVQIPLGTLSGVPGGAPLFSCFPPVGNQHYTAEGQHEGSPSEVGPEVSQDGGLLLRRLARATKADRQDDQAEGPQHYRDKEPDGQHLLLFLHGDASFPTSSRCSGR